MDIKYYKLEIYIPESHFSALQKALRDVDAGHIGNYDCCLNYSKVIGTWRPLEGTNPFIGETNQICEAEELKVEVTIQKENLYSTISAIKDIHPYEEPVINVVPLIEVGI